MGRLLTTAALLEMALDKAPRAPSRLQPLALCARLLSGAAAANTTALPPAFGVGAVGALLAAHVGYRARQKAVAISGFPDFGYAVLEDAIAAALAGVGARPQQIKN